MDEQSKQMRLEQFEQLCRERGIPCTIQRRVILEAILDSDTHPTANQVFADVKQRNREISRATVHRNLDRFVKLGLIVKTCHADTVIRYDACMEMHHHLVCMNCNKIIDLTDDALDRLKMPDTSKYDFEVNDYHVQIRGICKECRERTEIDPPAG